MSVAEDDTSDPYWPMKCGRDCACTFAAPVLGLDTSHVSVLARAATHICHTSGSDPSQQPRHIKNAIVAHSCGGSRRCVTSRSVWDFELDPLCIDCRPRKWAPEIDSASLELVVVEEDAQLGQLIDDLYNYRDRVGSTVGTRDISLVAVSESVAEDDNTDGVLITNDEALLDLLGRMTGEGEIRTVAIHSIELLTEMVHCGALSADGFTLITDAEDSHLDGYESADVIAIKRNRIRKAVNRVALLEER